ncbi:hypothetical protein BN1013_01486 [Candidatus Rubidus massiliensis]|nr:MAG: hypothetical protein BGO10_04815 [Chlamydia sp. 32-24]CDZ80958.1 hypothetical protein BN1013_01486 [Candidatus Rubidus massiliensis]
MTCRLDNGFVKFCSALPLVGDLLNPIARNHVKKNHSYTFIGTEEHCNPDLAKHHFAQARVAKDVIGLTSAVAAFALLFFVFAPPVSALIGLIIAGTIAAAGVYYLVDGIIATVRLRQTSIRLATGILVE